VAVAVVPGAVTQATGFHKRQRQQHFLLSNTPNAVEAEAMTTLVGMAIKTKSAHTSGTARALVVGNEHLASGCYSTIMLSS